LGGAKSKRLAELCLHYSHTREVVICVSDSECPPVPVICLQGDSMYFVIESVGTA